MTNYLTIDDVNGPKYFAPDVIPGAVSNAYNAQVNNILTIYNDYIQGTVTLQDTDPTNTQTYAPAIFQELLAAKDSLIDLASNGLPLTQGGTGYLNQNMAQALNTLFQTFDIAGISDTNGSASAATQMSALQNWLDLSTAGLGNVLSTAGQAGQSGRSIQAMIELEYIQAGNNLISNQLGSLESALGYTQQAVNILTTLQNIMNKVSPSNVAASLNSFMQTISGDSANNYVADYQADGGSRYNSPIGVVPNGITQTDVNNFTMYSSYTGPLHALISALLQVASPPFTGGVDGANGAFVSTTGGFNPNASSSTASLAGTLAANLYQVYYDMRYPSASSVNSRTQTPNPPGGVATPPWQATPNYPDSVQQTAFSSPNNRLDFWIIDNMGNAQKQGVYSNDLTTSQTSAESLNSSQSQQVQQTLFLFQEFYQSGSGMLTQINQIIQAMAQGAGQ